MKGYSFETFQVQEGNQAAYELCRAVASLEYTGPRPVLLLGPEGSGKGHLLWSIVHEVRASTVKAGLGLVMAHEFPIAVRNLAVNPEPIQRGNPAILLVDELERFHENVPELEAVVQTFLDNGHCVLLASNVAPDRLGAFSDAFKKCLREGQTIPIKPLVIQIPAGGETVTALRSELEALRRDRDAWAGKAVAADSLRTELEAVRRDRDEWAGKAAVTDSLRAELDTVRRDRDEKAGRSLAADSLRAELETVRRDRDEWAGKALAADSLRAELETVRRDRDEWTRKAVAADSLRAELDAVRRDRDEWAEKASVVEGLSAELEAVSRERDHWAEKAAVVDGLRAELEAVSRERDHWAEKAAVVDGLRAELETVSREHDDAVRRLTAQDAEIAEGLLWRERAETAESNLETALEENARLQTVLRAKEGIEATLKETRQERDAMTALLQERGEQLESLLEQVESQRAAMNAHCEALTARFQAYVESMESAQEALSRAEREAYQSEVDEARAHAATLREQLDMDHREFSEALAQIRAERDETDGLLEESRAEQDRLRAALDAVRGRLNALGLELDTARRTVSLQAAEMDALRHEAAAQVASANVRTGEMERRTARLQSFLEDAVENSRATETDAQRCGEDLTRIAETLRALAARHAMWQDAELESKPEPEPEPNDGQALLFDAVPDFDARDSLRLSAFTEGLGAASGELPGSGPSLKDMVDAALADPPQSVPPDAP
jgi:chromosome segregation ATPase